MLCCDCLHVCEAPRSEWWRLSQVMCSQEHGAESRNVGIVGTSMAASLSLFVVCSLCSRGGHELDAWQQQDSWTLYLLQPSTR